MPSPSTKAFLPLESNPEVFNELLRMLGVSSRLQFEDVFSLDEPDFLPHPALAAVLVFPADDVLKADAASEREAYAGSGADEPVVWFRQTIQNACGLYAILHGVCNGEAVRYIEPDGVLARLLKASTNLPPEGRARVLEESAELEKAHATVALKGDSAVPESAEAEVEFHYICYVMSAKDGHVFELDGDRKGPIDTGLVLSEGEDVLCEKVVGLIRKYADEADGNLNFSLLALVDRGSES
ncbi:ubiquitin carboxyl-terminal hydrolase, family 1 [Coniochaeta ligniaria NRRL 30616]|uniref:Ubiquitin carboxyl-terminal hydrolase n=1 Tax=Coniochaeta ligniaria NRRL 30616 TaxID=1408157 RepID=A0A1J7JUY2_9PEZI|nr:ubiquitin carboxyl-terminal hydrolase, family 1 [Coniochaeta ligniaria NRRL 30616]